MSPDMGAASEFGLLASGFFLDQEMISRHEGAFVGPDGVMDHKESETSDTRNPGDLCDSVANYCGELGRWWFAQAENPSHKYAYRNIANYIHASLTHYPGLIVDYACGAGSLLTRLSKRFPRSRFVGLDGSSFLLNLARRRLARMGRDVLKRVTLIETLLPSFQMSPLMADLVIYTFPNMVPPGTRSESDLDERGTEPHELAIGELLVQSSDLRDAHKGEDPVTVLQRLRFGRLVSLNLRGLLRRGGICVRVEYARVRRHELSRGDYLQTAFEEGSLDMEVEGIMPEHWFRVLASSFFRSRVTEDVYQQTGDEHDRGGGYVITVLRAI